MLPYHDGHSACLPTHPDARMFLGLLWPVKQLGTGPGFVCEGARKPGADTIKKFKLELYIVFQIIVYNRKIITHNILKWFNSAY